MLLSEVVEGNPVNVDVVDVVKVVSFPHEWRVDADGHIIASAVSKGHYAKIYLYQLILGLDNTTHVIFANGNKRDFTRENLLKV